MHVKQLTSSLKLVVILAQCRYTEIGQRVFIHSDIQYNSLTPDKIPNSLVYRTLFLSTYMGVKNFKKQSGFLAYPVVYKYNEK